MGKIIGINLLILLIYSLFFKFSTSSQIGDLVLLAFLIVLHVLVNIIWAFISKETRSYFFLSALLVLIVGFATCVLPINT